MIKVVFQMAAAFQDSSPGDLRKSINNDPQWFSFGVGINGGNLRERSGRCPGGKSVAKFRLLHVRGVLS
jgi:hypothetical protein